MTESEAREKWCPFVRLMVTTTVGNPPPAYNRSVGIVTGGGQVSHNSSRTNCIASDCMMWLEKNGDGHCGLTQDK